MAFDDRRPWLLGAVLAIAGGLWAGLARLGVGIPAAAQHHPMAHGPLMVGAFLGTVISLERAVAVARRWAYLAPALSGLAGVLLLLRPHPRAPAVALTVASALLLLAYLPLLRRRADLAMTVMAAGAASWCAGTVLWLVGRPLPLVFPFWAAFAVLTIAGERLELSRLLAPTALARWLFLAAVGLLVAGLVALELRRLDLGLRLVGAGQVGLAVWLLRWDLATRTVRFPGRHRYTALCLLGGLLWLGVAGVVLLLRGLALGGLLYDVALHALFIGFVFAMIFGHLPIIAPMLLRCELRFTPLLYLPLALLHLSLALRIAAGLAGWLPGRAAGAVGNAMAIVLFGLLAVPRLQRRPEG